MVTLSMSPRSCQAIEYEVRGRDAQLSEDDGAALLQTLRAIHPAQVRIAFQPILHCLS